MFVVFADQESTANTIAYMHANSYSIRENLSTGHSVKVYTFEIYPLYSMYLQV